MSLKSTSIFGIILPIALIGCVETTEVAVSQTNLSAQSRAMAISAISQRLRDPDSLLTRNIQGYRTSAGDTVVCGEYNARNAFGGYTGYADFYVRIRDGVVRVVYQDGDAEYFYPAAAGCQRAASGLLPLPATDVPDGS